MLARFLYIFILLFFIESDLLAQGMLFDSTKYQQIYFEEPRRETISRPDSFSLKKYAPTPLEQGDNNSCVACAIIHAYVISRNSC